MAMTSRNNAKIDTIIMCTLDDLVAQDHLVRKLEDSIDFRFIYPKVWHHYSKLVLTSGNTKYRSSGAF